MNRRAWAPGMIFSLMLLAFAASAHAQDMMRARATYDQLCANCHGVQGDGSGAFAVGLLPRPTNFTRFPPGRIDADGDGKAATPMDFALVTRDGAAAFQGSPSMPPIVNLGGSAELIPDLVAFIFAQFVPRRAGGGAALSARPAGLALKEPRVPVHPPRASRRQAVPWQHDEARGVPRPPRSALRSQGS